VSSITSPRLPWAKLRTNESPIVSAKLSASGVSGWAAAKVAAAHDALLSYGPTKPRASTVTKPDDDMTNRLRETLDSADLEHPPRRVRRTDIQDARDRHRRPTAALRPQLLTRRHGELPARPSDRRQGGDAPHVTRARDRRYASPYRLVPRRRPGTPGRARRRGRGGPEMGPDRHRRSNAPMVRLGLIDDLVPQCAVITARGGGDAGRLPSARSRARDHLPH
jgi:hypothetical protein